MKTINTKYGYYFRDDAGYWATIIDGETTNCLSKQGIISFMRTLFLLNGKRKLN
ncbi:MAG: hypothetical protein PF487_13130 [Bacteroidales bacterium]|jgi:hypothetical protein|nr:hypothetical protein [Bacteroidales bacterium]